MIIADDLLDRKLVTPMTAVLGGKVGHVEGAHRQLDRRHDITTGTITLRLLDDSAHLLDGDLNDQGYREP
jgi:hypothetical protein